MARKEELPRPQKTRRTYDEDFKREAVQMMLDGLSPSSVAKRLGLPSTNSLYNWRKRYVTESGPVAESLEARVQQLEDELRRVERERDILKKSLGHFQPERIADRYAAIEQIVGAGQQPTATVCQILGVSRAGYYAWRREVPSARKDRDRELLPLVKAIFIHHRRRYGARRIAQELAHRGQACGVERVAKLLKIAGLRAIQPKSYQPKTTDSRHTLGYSPNLLLEREFPQRLDAVWVGDITYLSLSTAQRFTYLALLMDLYSRRIVGWQLRDDMTEELTILCLKQAVRVRQPPAGLVHHTDRGGQYAGRAYRSILRRAVISQSMSRAGNCYDTAFLESCFGTIKTELEMTEYESSGAALKEIRAYISYYNHERLHSSLGYLSPVQFENQMAKIG